MQLAEKMPKRHGVISIGLQGYQSPGVPMHNLLEICDDGPSGLPISLQLVEWITDMIALQVCPRLEIFHEPKIKTYAQERFCRSNNYRASVAIE